MKLFLGMLLCCTLVARSTQKLTKQEMREALNQNPLFSHPRWGQDIPQSINLLVPTADVQSNIHFSAKRRRRPSFRPKDIPGEPPLMALAKETTMNDAIQSEIQAGRSIKAGKPMFREQMIGTVATAPLVRTDPNPVMIVSPDMPVVAPMETAPIQFVDQDPPMSMGSGPMTIEISNADVPPLTVVSQDSFPVPLNREPIVIANRPISKPVVNDRMADKMISKQTPSEQRPIQLSEIKPPTQKPRCSFQIPSFLLPDPDIPQIDFEQTYLLPALRAYLLQSEHCRSRALTVYLDWLLHLRERLFTV